MADLNYDSSSSTFVGGVSFQPAEGWELGLDAVLSEADASLDQFDFIVPADYLARNVNQSYDFTQTHTYSDLDVSRLELGLRFRYQTGERFAFYGGYRYLDFEDDAPYLYDTSGTVDLYHLGVGWTF